MALSAHRDTPPALRAEHIQRRIAYQYAIDKLRADRAGQDGPLSETMRVELEEIIDGYLAWADANLPPYDKDKRDTPRGLADPGSPTDG